MKKKDTQKMTIGFKKLKDYDTKSYPLTKNSKNCVIKPPQFSFSAGAKTPLSSDLGAIKSKEVLKNTFLPSLDLIELKPFDYENIFKKCPKCKKRIVKTKVKKENNDIYQLFECKRKKCEGFYCEIKISL